eukprot:c10078_g1_i2.p2 GENE.c10078_g1_i2~~c10078_g1_i2.p2  ORF type:complete len:217 (+),score=39.52 c10078_g1_i2:756-1406(+)
MVAKMHASRTTASSLPLTTDTGQFMRRGFVVCNEDDWSYLPLPKSLENKEPKYTLDDRWNAQDPRPLFLFAPFYSTAHHRVWTAFDKGGTVFCVKFFEPEDANAAAAEADCWNLLWGAEVGAAKVINRVAGQHALIMPLIHDIRDENRHVSWQKVKQALTAMAAKGVKHLDLHWRHVGLHNNKVVFIDLGQVEIVPHPDQAWEQQAVKEMYAALFP